MGKSFKSGKFVVTGQLPGEVTEVKLEEREFSVTDRSFIKDKELIPDFMVISVNSK